MNIIVVWNACISIFYSLFEFKKQKKRLLILTSRSVIPSPCTGNAGCDAKIAFDEILRTV